MVPGLLHEDPVEIEIQLQGGLPPGPEAVGFHLGAQDLQVRIVEDPVRRTGTGGVLRQDHTPVDGYDDQQGQILGGPIGLEG